jgi:hypothetical protein
MNDALITYVQDHLAGARFAIELIEDLHGQKDDAELARFAGDLLSQVQADRQTLEGLLEASSAEDPSALKEAATALAQKASRLKLSMSDPFGRFEAVEILPLGVLGKRALWRTLEAVSQSQRLRTLDWKSLIGLAEQQHAALEELRLRLAAGAFPNGVA